MPSNIETDVEYQEWGFGIHTEFCQEIWASVLGWQINDKAKANGPVAP
jgi:hypothetical protein